MNGIVVSSILGRVRGKRRRAFALGEALILIVVVLITFGGIFSSIDYAMRLREQAQADLDGYMTAQAWFEALESEEPEKIDGEKMLDSAAGRVINRLGGETLGFGRYRVRNLLLFPRFGGAVDGALRIDLVVRKPARGKEGAPLNFSRSYNVHDSNTVEDNAYKRLSKS